MYDSLSPYELAMSTAVAFGFYLQLIANISSCMHGQQQVVCKRGRRVLQNLFGWPVSESRIFTPQLGFDQQFLRTVLFDCATV